MKNTLPMRVLGILAFAWFSAAAVWSDAEPTTIASVEPATVHVGERVRIMIDLEWRAPVSILPVVPPGETGVFRVVSIKESEPASQPGGTLRRRVEIEAAVFAVGAQEFPPVEIRYVDAEGAGRRMHTEPLHVRVESVLPGPEEAELQPIRAPLRIPMSRREILGYGAGLLALLALAAATVWWLRNRRGCVPADRIATPPPLPPDEEALRALARLEADRAVEREAAKALYFALSEILRRYLGRRYGFDALEMTSGELIERIERLGWSEDMRSRLLEDLAESDAVKFAKYAPARPKRQAAFDRVRGIVLATRPVPAESAQSEEGAA